MAKIFIDPEDVFRGKDFSQAVKVDNTVYITGQTGYNQDLKMVGDGDCLAQAEQAFINLQNVLKAAGAEMSDVVKITYFYRNIDDYELVREKVAPKYYSQPRHSS